MTDKFKVQKLAPATALLFIRTVLRGIIYFHSWQVHAKRVQICLLIDMDIKKFFRSPFLEKIPFLSFCALERFIVMLIEALLWTMNHWIQWRISISRASATRKFKFYLRLVSLLSFFPLTQCIRSLTGCWRISPPLKHTSSGWTLWWTDVLCGSVQLLCLFIW